MNPNNNSNKKHKPAPLLFGLTQDELEARLAAIRQWVAKPIWEGDSKVTNLQHKPPETKYSSKFQDPRPALIAGNLWIGNKYHAANVDSLVELGITDVLNCASGGISRLPVDEMSKKGISYHFTNVRQDDLLYPILHDHKGVCSPHLTKAKALYQTIVKNQGKVLFFCVAGQNRSPTLALACLLLFEHSLDTLLKNCSQTRPFILENQGFQKQLVELETLLKTMQKTNGCYRYGTLAMSTPVKRTPSELERESQLVEIELLIPGLCTMDVKIPVESTIATVKTCLINHANQHLLSYEDGQKRVAKSWVALAMFGYDSMCDFPLETEAMDLDVQMQRIQTMFGLQIVDKQQRVVRWNAKCRFALVIFSVFTDKDQSYHTPWTFVHKERPGAPATLLENNLMSTSLRAWDFVTGQAFCSKQPIVFSFAHDPNDRQKFMKISTSATQAQQFHAPGEGGILGMGANAIVHRVELYSTSQPSPGDEDEAWDAAVKRPWSLSKMLASLQSSSEAGLAKRMRLANSLNSDGRVVYFYGLGVALSANAYNTQEYKFEATLLARYEEEFSTYTMKRFMKDYTSQEAIGEMKDLQDNFSLIRVKVLLVSLLNAFRDLTLMGVQAFDFNHLNNVLVSRDHQTVKLLDIDGNSKGSIQFPSEYIQGTTSPPPLTSAVSNNNNNNNGKKRKTSVIHKPSLDVDLNAVLPTVVQQLLLGKGRGATFVVNKKSEIWHATPPKKAKEMVKQVIRENFFTSQEYDKDEKAEKHIAKVTEWFYAMLKKQAPWGNWTSDIYDAMRCIDHLPVT